MHTRIYDETAHSQGVVSRSHGGRADECMHGQAESPTPMLILSSAGARRRGDSIGRDGGGAGRGDGARRRGALKELPLRLLAGGAAGVQRLGGGARNAGSDEYALLRGAVAAAAAAPLRFIRGSTPPPLPRCFPV